jgi:hypothetical protein
LLLTGPGHLPARAGDTLREELGRFAERIKKVLADEKLEAIDLGEFTGPPSPATSTGPGIQQLLLEELTARKVKVQRRAGAYVKGEYLPVEVDTDAVRDRVVLRLEAVVRDGKGRKLAAMKADVKSNLDIVRLFGLTCKLPTKGDAGDRNEELTRILEKPRAFADGTRVLARKDSPYAVEVLVRGAGGRAAPRMPSLDDGQAFVPIGSGARYEVRVYNDSAYDTAASVSVDGIDAFTFSQVREAKTGRPQYTHYIVPAGKTATVQGWHRTDQRAASFEVGSYGDSAAARLLRANPRLGTITVCFHAAWKGKDAPPDEKGSRSPDDVGTRLGPPIEAGTRPVQRTVGVLRDSVSVRYSKKR